MPKKSMPKTEAAWKKKLTPEQYNVLREKGTEPVFSGKLLHVKEKGMFVCAGCDTKIFSSDTKFDSGTGWPSFFDAIPDSVELKDDYSGGMSRIEVICKNCKSHLGHLFKDGPKPTGKRYCINSAALKFKSAVR